MIVLEVLNPAGHTIGWVGEHDRLVHGQLLARQLPNNEPAVRVAMSRARANLDLSARYELVPVEVGHQLPAPADPLDALGIEVLAHVQRGSILVVPAPHEAITRDRIRQFRDEVAERVGHDEFGVVFTGADDATTRLLSAAVAMAEGDLVYVASPGVCPQCGSDQVTIHRDETTARACTHCGHRWSQFHPGESAA